MLKKKRKNYFQVRDKIWILQSYHCMIRLVSITNDMYWNLNCKYKENAIGLMYKVIFQIQSILNHLILFKSNLNHHINTLILIIQFE